MISHFFLDNLYLVKLLFVLTIRPEMDEDSLEQRIVRGSGKQSLLLQNRQQASPLFRTPIDVRARQLKFKHF